MEIQTEEETAAFQEKPIQDRLRQASSIMIESASRNRVSLSISWYNTYGEQQNQRYSISAGSVIEL